MRVVIHGVGAIGGTIAAALIRSGQDVLGIARGAQLAALQASDLCLRTSRETVHVRVPVVETPARIDWRADDVVLLTMKSQHTEGALSDLRAAGLTSQAIFSFQNGIANEDLALRYFPNVHGATVMMPSSYETPGEVIAYGTPMLGVFDLGRYPRGSDAQDAALAQRLDGAGMRGFTTDDVMASKRGKLLMNLSNIVVAALGVGVDQGPLPALLTDEARKVFAAAGLSLVEVGLDDPRRKDLMQIGEVAGAPRMGNSTAQSLARGAASVETDYMNGEISYLGRKHGVATPANDAMTLLGQHMVRGVVAPGALSLEDLLARVRA